MRARVPIGQAALLLVALVGLLVPGGAEAAKVVNGSFESGSLGGWQVQRAVGAGDWFAYTGTAAPIGSKRPNPADPVQPPPHGAFAAIADQANPDSLILYQDVALEPGRNHQLSLLAYYDSYSPIAIPNPNTLSISDQALRLPNGKFRQNQQFRIDVIRPEAALESLGPTDILRTVFATKLGGKLSMPPTELSANLSAFAGQTVRIRIAVAVTEEVLNAGVDAVSITSSAEQTGSRGGGKPELFGFGRLGLKRGKGIATLRVRVSAPGLLRAAGIRRPAEPGPAGRWGGPRRLIEPTTVSIGTARTVTLRLRPTRATRALLKRRQRLRVPVAVTFMPVGGAVETARLPVAFRLANLSK